MIKARALVSLLLICGILTIILALLKHAHGADSVTACSSERVQDRAHWAWREIDGRRCWYRGEPGRAKSLLRWNAQALPSAGTGRPESRDTKLLQPPALGAVPVEPNHIKTEEPTTWQATPEDQLKAFTCCWPELEHPSPPPRSVEKNLPKNQERYTPIVIPPATPPIQPLWPIMLLPVAIVLLAALLWWPRNQT